MGGKKDINPKLAGLEGRGRDIYQANAKSNTKSDGVDYGFCHALCVISKAVWRKMYCDYDSDSCKQMQYFLGHQRARRIKGENRCFIAFCLSFYC